MTLGWALSLREVGKTKRKITCKSNLAGLPAIFKLGHYPDLLLKMKGVILGISHIKTMSRDKIKAFYSNEMEKDRLEQELFKLEGIRTKEIISRFITKNPLDIADIGGGAGFYAFWLQAAGHHVSLADLSPRNIELANEYSQKTGIQLTACRTGDATNLDFDAEQFDMVLLLGPLYHLINKKERVKALSEAKRILKPNGFVLSAIISRYASLFDGFKRDLIIDDRFEKILVNDLTAGVHLNETENPEYFTTAYFHTPAEIKQEIIESGLQLKELIAVESFGWIIDNFKERSADKGYMEKLHKILNMVETNNDLIAMSPHIIAVAQKDGVPVSHKDAKDTK
jgi:ubiquinone/menaquinone biosynthesis C-methylase UbiE